MRSVNLLGLAAAITLAAAFSVTADAQTPKRGGILTMGMEGEPPNLDCHQSTSIFVPQLVRPLYSNLVRYDQANFPTIVGDLAESWSVSQDALAYTFKLRPNVKFHDGSPFTADDVKASFERIIAPPQGVASLWRADFADVRAIETPDPMTVVFRLGQANVAFIELFANPFSCVYSAKKLATAPLYPMTEPMGTGPFQFVQYQRGSVFEGKRFDGYFRPGLPYLDGYRHQAVTQGAPAINALIAGQLDVNMRGLQPAEQQAVTSQAAGRIKFQTSPLILQNMYEINFRRKPFDDVRVRRALNMAIDRKGGHENLQRILSQAGYGGIIRAGSEFALPRQEVDKLLGADLPIAQARAEARRLLAEAGQSNLKVVLVNREIPIFTTLGIYVIDQLRQIGVGVQHDLLNPQQAVSRINPPNYDFDITLQTNSRPSDDPTFMLVKFLPDNPANLSGFKDQTLADLYQKQKATTDRAQRGQLVNDFERRLLGEAYIMPLFWSLNTRAYANNVQGFVHTPSYSVGYELTEVWKE